MQQMKARELTKLIVGCAINFLLGMAISMFFLNSQFASSPEGGDSGGDNDEMAAP